MGHKIASPGSASPIAPPLEAPISPRGLHSAHLLPPVPPVEIHTHKRARLHGLLKNIELNGLSGVILPPSATDVQGTVKVRLDTGREVAARLENIEFLSSDA